MKKIVILIILLIMVSIRFSGTSNANQVTNTIKPDTNNNTQKSNDKTEITLRTTGDTYTIDGYIAAISTNSQVATVDVDNDKVTITGISAGNAMVIVKDLYGNKNAISVMVVENFPALGTWQWDLASGEACYFNENEAYCSGPLNSDVKNFWTAESSSKPAFQTFTNQLCKTLLHVPERNVTAGYAYDEGYLIETGVNHSGIDIKARRGKPVFSPINGDVYDTVTDEDQYNRLLIKEENSSRIWIFGHMTPLAKWVNSVHVEEGDKLGIIHSYPSGDHLHLEVKKDSGDWMWTDDRQEILDETISPMQAYYEYFFGTSSSCGAYVAPGVWKEFDCYNLAAIGKTTDDDPFTPSWRLIGGYWQWGRKGPDESEWYDTNTSNFAHGPTGSDEADANDDSIDGWDTSYADDGAWSDDEKTSNDPCPSGYRVPTQAQWEGVDENNEQSTVGTWSMDATNYSSGRFLGDDLMLPAAGYRYNDSGWVHYRGDCGFYWSSTVFFDSFYAGTLRFDSSSADTSYYFDRSLGFSVRCIAE